MLAGHIGNYSRYEIERKFLLKKLPSSLPEDFIDIHDRYLNNSRLRYRVEHSPAGEIIARKLTKKDKAPDQGPETSIITSLYLSADDALALGHLDGATLRKRRYILESPDRRVVYDVFQDELLGLIMAEVEFKEPEAMLSFEPDYVDWKEVTGDPMYSGGYLAFHKSPL